MLSSSVIVRSDGGTLPLPPLSTETGISVSHYPGHALSLSCAPLSLSQSAVADPDHTGSDRVEIRDSKFKIRVSSYRLITGNLAAAIKDAIISMGGRKTLSRERLQEFERVSVHVN